MRDKGLTLIEILVVVILIGLSLAVLLSLVTSAKSLLKRTQNDGQALSIALAKKEELLSRSYEHLDLCSGCRNQDTEDVVFEWNTSVTENSLCNGTRCIPYKEIDVTVEYPEETVSGASADNQKRVVLKDIVPYPLVHVESTNSGVSSCKVADGCEVLDDQSWSVVAGALNPDNDLRIDLPVYVVDKDFLVIYDIAINIEDATALTRTDNILTRARGYQTNNQAVEVFGIPTTQTPIISQGSISNILRFEDVPRDIPHTVEIQWRKNTAGGNISVRKSSLVVIAVEKKGE